MPEVNAVTPTAAVPADRLALGSVDARNPHVSPANAAGFCFCPTCFAEE